MNWFALVDWPAQQIASVLVYLLLMGVLVATIAAGAVLYDRLRPRLHWVPAAIVAIAAGLYVGMVLYRVLYWTGLVSSGVINAVGS